MLLLTIIVAWSFIVAEVSRVEVCFSEAQREGERSKNGRVSMCEVAGLDETYT